MRDVARVVALLLAVVVLARDTGVAGGGEAIATATFITVLLVLVALTLWRDGFVTASGIALAAHYGAALVYGRVVADLGAPVVAALIVAYLDVADLATSLPSDRRIDRAFLLARLRRTGVVLAAGAVAAAAVAGVASVRWPGTAAFRIVGVAGVALVVAVPAWVLRARR